MEPRADGREEGALLIETPDQLRIVVNDFSNALQRFLSEGGTGNNALRVHFPPIRSIARKLDNAEALTPDDMRVLKSTAEQLSGTLPSDFSDATALYEMIDYATRVPQGVPAVGAARSGPASPSGSGAPAPPRARPSFSPPQRPSAPPEEGSRRGASLHRLVLANLGEELGPPFKRGRGGPGGWVLLQEAELHLGGEAVQADFAGWRRDRMPETPDGSTDVPPDWVAEILAPSTYADDRARKVPLYAREGVPFVWLVEPQARVVEALRLDGEGYRIAGVWCDAARARVAPFDAIELELDALWAR